MSCSLLALAASLAGPAHGVEIAAERHQLSNGLTVLLHEEHAVPVVTFQVFYRCGGKDEVAGTTGISHLLEHMMFNGSERYGPKEFDRLLEAAGGSSNGYTWKDQTTYMETFPPAALELVLAMEADRMRALAITPENLEQERGVVAEERRWSVDNDNDGAMWEALLSLMFQAHPYRDPVVGWMDDIQSFQQADLQAWYDRCYAPANAMIVLAGDIEPAVVMPALEQSFGGLEPGQAVVHPRWNEPEQQGLRQAELHRPAGQTSISIGYVGPAAVHPDQPALELLDYALSGGRSSFLVDRLVHKEAVFTDATSALIPLEQASLFLVDASLAEGVELPQALAAIEELFTELRGEPVEEARLARARRQLELDLYHQLETVEERADMLGSWHLFYGGIEAMVDRPAAWAEQDGEALRAAAERWLRPERRNLVVLYPSVEGGEE
jgi:zinc protease